MKFSKILIGAALAVAPIAVTISPAGATAAHGPEFEWKYASAGGNFTDCPVGPVASETQCTGINFYAEAFDVQVGETERHVEQGGAQKFTVHLHVGGTFNIDPMPFAGGRTYANATIQVFQSWKGLEPEFKRYAIFHELGHGGFHRGGLAFDDRLAPAHEAGIGFNLEKQPPGRHLE